MSNYAAIIAVDLPWFSVPHSFARHRVGVRDIWTKM